MILKKILKMILKLNNSIEFLSWYGNGEVVGDGVGVGVGLTWG